MYLRGRNRYKQNTVITKQLEEKMRGKIFEEECSDIIKYMYNEADSHYLLKKLKKLYH